MIFSPITERSTPVRSLYVALYSLLILGAVTMILPFLIMISDSVEPKAVSTETTFFPPYLFDSGALWERYLEVKYHGSADLLRMAWNNPSLMFEETANLLNERVDTEAVKLWQRFLKEAPPDPVLFTLGFMRPNARMPSYTNFEFRNWLLKKYGSLEGINLALGSEFPRVNRIEPPLPRIDGPPLPSTPAVQAFVEFSASQPLSQKFAWDVGAFYRTSILPRTVGADIAQYNGKFGTSYASYTEVPFPATAPEVGAEPWFFFVSRLLRTDFLQLTDAGRVNHAESGLGRDVFIRTQSKPEDLRVVSVDTLFGDWAAAQGRTGLLIPQASIDREAFAAEKGFWRNQFLTLNYRTVIDEIGGHGGALRNTLILVILSVGGALIINPLAAYALSRYKMRSSYHILLFFLATIAFPGEVTMIPVFLQLREFNLLNTFGALVLPGLANGFSIFLLKGFFDSLPRELYEAAELDGVSEFKMFWLITMNLSKPILAVIALSAFTTAYGAFFFALILAPDPSMWTLMVYVFQLRMSVASPVVYASLILTAIPTLIVFITCQNMILRGIVVPSDK